MRARSRPRIAKAQGTETLASPFSTFLACTGSVRLGSSGSATHRFRILMHTDALTQNSYPILAKRVPSDHDDCMSPSVESSEICVALILTGSISLPFEGPASHRSALDTPLRCAPASLDKRIQHLSTSA